jgi:hypothetical protein
LADSADAFVFILIGFDLIGSLATIEAMNEKNKKIAKLLIFLSLLAWLGFLMAQRIDLATADLGRHIKNGEWVVAHHFDLKNPDSPVHENFYSYTHPDFPVINHHWGSGVIFFELYKFFGFSGLSIFYIALAVFSFAFFFYIAKRESNFTIAAVLSLLLIPLVAERREIRPEIFSYLFAGIFFWLLWSWRRRELKANWLYVLPVLMIFWVNLHVYFFLGLFFLGAYWLADVSQLLFSKQSDEEFSETLARVKKLTVVSILSVLAAFLNPFGWRGLIYPLQIFKNYGYTIVENRSVNFVETYGIVNPNFLLIKIVLGALALSFVLLFLVDRKKISFAYLLFALFFGITGWMAIRNFTSLGLFALPILSANFEGIFTPNKKNNLPAKENGLALAYILIGIFAVFGSWQFATAHSAGKGIGLLPGSSDAAEFLRNEEIAGPIFNDYDIGGYLIFNLPASPDRSAEARRAGDSENEKVFVDNRPEAYPDSFFSETYKPMQDNPEIFFRVDQKYNFNAVVFFRNDITPWGQNFLKSISQDENWLPAYRDDYAIIYLKNNEQNQSIIDRYKL